MTLPFPTKPISTISSHSYDTADSHKTNFHNLIPLL
jgi:hypothetical protein